MGEKISTNVNTIEFSETQTERTFKASFTDTVGKSISESFGMILTNKIGTRNILPPSFPPPIDDEPKQPDTVDTEVEVVANPSITEDIPKIDKKEIPGLNEIKLRDLAKNETDWLLVYMYSASEGGTKEFKRAHIIQLYKDTDRRTDGRIKNLSQAFKNLSKPLYIKPTNDTDFILLEKRSNASTRNI